MIRLSRQMLANYLAKNIHQQAMVELYPKLAKLILGSDEVSAIKIGSILTISQSTLVIVQWGEEYFVHVVPIALERKINLDPQSIGISQQEVEFHCRHSNSYPAVGINRVDFSIADSASNVLNFTGKYECSVFFDSPMQSVAGKNLTLRILWIIGQDFQHHFWYEQNIQLPNGTMRFNFPVENARGGDDETLASLCSLGIFPAIGLTMVTEDLPTQTPIMVAGVNTTLLLARF